MLRTLEPLLLRQHRPPVAAGVAVSLASVAAATALIYPLKHVAPVVSLGVVYLLSVLVLSTYWGLAFGVLTSVASTIAFNFFHLPPVGQITLAEGRDWVALAAFLTVALAVSTIAEAARARAIEADERRREADLAAELTGVLLGGAALPETLPLAARRLAEAIGATSASIELGSSEPAERRQGIPLHDGATQVGTLVVPSDLPAEQASRLRERIVPALESILAAALARELLQAEVVETASLRRSDDMKTAVLRSVSHDLRTPLTAILTSAAALGSPTLDDDERDEVLSGIVGDADPLVAPDRQAARPLPPAVRQGRATADLVRNR